jgi:hypothetical protein
MWRGLLTPPAAHRARDGGVRARRRRRVAGRCRGGGVERVLRVLGLEGCAGMRVAGQLMLG